MKNPIMLTLIAAAAVITTPLSAQTGTRIQNSRTVAAPEAGQRFADCLADFKRSESEAYVQATPGSPAAEEARRALMPFRENRCVQFAGLEVGGRTLIVDSDLLRGQVAQALYLARYGSGAPATIADAQAATIPVEVYNQRIRNAANTRAEVLRIFGDCVAAAEPMAVDALIRTSVNSDGESAAISRLSEVFGPCLWEGQSIQFTAESLRAALAEGLYRKAEGRAVTTLAADAGAAS